MRKNLLLVLFILLTVILSMGIFGRSQEITYGPNYTTKMGILSTTSYFYWLPLVFGLLFIYFGLGYYFSTLTTRRLLIIFPITVLTLPQLFTLFHPFINPNFPETFQGLCENPQQLSSSTFTPAGSPPYKISTAQNNRELYRLFPRSWRATNVKNTRLVLCSSELNSEILEEKTYDDGVALPVDAQRIIYFQDFYVVDTISGKRIDQWRGYGSTPPVFPEILKEDPFQEDARYYLIVGDKNVNTGLLDWLNPIVNQGNPN